MRNPFTDPFCREEDLGLALPESDHAVSVCLPRWRHVIGYEEGDPAVIDTFESGYPRFVPHPLVLELFEKAAARFGGDGETALVFPSLAAAWRCADHVKRRAGASCRLESFDEGCATAVILPGTAWEAAWKCWQHGGEILSSRMAEALLSGAPRDAGLLRRGEGARATLRERIASFHPGLGPGEVFLFSSGMAAIFALHRILTLRAPGLPTVQIEFPYLDTFKLQEQFGEGGAVDFTVTSSGGLEELRAWLGGGGRAAAVYAELPSNPLLRTPDLLGAASLLAEHGVPLVVDDTVASCVNVDAFRCADAVTSSLTKVFSGAGDVAAGAVAVNPASPFREELLAALGEEEAASPLHESDALVLEVNSRRFEERVRGTDAGALAVAEWLQGRPEVEKLWHPSTETRDHYDSLRREGGGHGALLSFTLRGGEPAAARFYDALRVSKGPGLGTEFSLACPYTLMAHYGELDWAEARGARRDLLRLWVGLEEPEDLCGRLEEALAGC